jgi:hypothetical protein
MRRQDWGQAMRSAPFLFTLLAALSFDAPARAQDTGRHNHFIDSARGPANCGATPSFCMAASTSAANRSNCTAPASIPTTDAPD